MAKKGGANMTVINFEECRAAKDKKDGLYDMTLWVGEDYKNNNEMYVEVADMMEDAICWGHYLADVVRALVRDNPQIETARADGNVLQEIVDGLNEWLREGISVHEDLAR
jgi:hypothetical protein